MSRNKLKKFEDNKHRTNIIEPGKPLFETIRGNWHKKYFQNDCPITLELACGKGEYTVGLAQKFPQRNFIGIDYKGDRIWKGSTIAQEEGFGNVGFLRSNIYFLPDFFLEGEIDEIWITFPDPRPRDREERRRITAPHFLDIYKRIIRSEGYVRFKTDNTDLFNYTLEKLKERTDINGLTFTHDLYHSDFIEECHNIRTRYEKKFSAEGHDIKYLKFRFT